MLILHMVKIIWRRVQVALRLEVQRTTAKAEPNSTQQTSAERKSDALSFPLSKLVAEGDARGVPYPFAQTASADENGNAFPTRCMPNDPGLFTDGGDTALFADVGSSLALLEELACREADRATYANLVQSRAARGVLIQFNMATGAVILAALGLALSLVVTGSFYRCSAS